MSTRLSGVDRYSTYTTAAATRGVTPSSRQLNEMHSPSAAMNRATGNGQMSSSYARSSSSHVGFGGGGGTTTRNTYSGPTTTTGLRDGYGTAAHSSNRLSTRLGGGLPAPTAGYGTTAAVMSTPRGATMANSGCSSSSAVNRGGGSIGYSSSGYGGGGGGSRYGGGGNDEQNLGRLDEIAVYHDSAMRSSQKTLRSLEEEPAGAGRRAPSSNYPPPSTSSLARLNRTEQHSPTPPPTSASYYPHGGGDGYNNSSAATTPTSYDRMNYASQSTAGGMRPATLVSSSTTATTALHRPALRPPSTTNATAAPPSASRGSYHTQHQHHHTTAATSTYSSHGSGSTSSMTESATHRARLNQALESANAHTMGAYYGSGGEVSVTPTSSPTTTSLSTTTSAAVAASASARTIFPSSTLHTAAPKGFRNMGNTCYLNSAMQAFIASPRLMEKICEEADNNPSLFKGKGMARDVIDLVCAIHGVPSPTEGCGGRGGGGWKSLLSSMFSSGGGGGASSTSHILSSIKSLCRDRNDEFTGARQNDAHEFLRVFMLLLHEKLNRIAGKPKYVEMKDIAGEGIEDASDRWWDYHLSRDDSVVYDLFGGQQHSTIECGVCGKVSLSFDPFLDLFLRVSEHAHRPTISLLLQAYTGVTRLEGVNRFYCGACKRATDSRQQVRIARFPRLLTIALVRFDRQGRKNAVSVPIEEYLETDKDCSSFLESFAYELYSLVIHSGTVDYGHYYAYVKKGPQWYRCDDSTVTEVPFRIVQQESSGVYVLFYRQAKKR